MSELALKLIAENKAKHARGEDARVLDLGYCGLTEVPEEVGGLVWLEVLNLGACVMEIEGERKLLNNVFRFLNKFTLSKTLPFYENDSLLIHEYRLFNNIELSNGLKFIVYKVRKSKQRGHSNDIKRLPKFLSNLVNLKALLLDWAGTEDIAPIKKMVNLEVLFTPGLVRDFSPIANLNKIRVLKCPGPNVFYIDFLEDLVALEVLDLSCCKNLSDISPINKLKNLKALDLSGKTGSRVMTDDSYLFQVNWEGLTQIEYINLNHGYWGKLQPLLPLIKRGILISSDSSKSGIIGGHFHSPPLEVILQGNTAILNYFSELSKKQFKNTQIKLILLGNSTAGKTTLSRYLREQAYDPTQPTTHGIQNHRWQSPSGREMEVNIWDFGGQEYFHATHRLFLSRNAVYALLWDAKTDKGGIEPTEIHYENDPQAYTVPLEHFSKAWWLKNIHFNLNKYARHEREGDAPIPVLLVQNKCAAGESYEMQDVPNEFGHAPFHLPAKWRNHHIDIAAAANEQTNNEQGEWTMRFKLFENELLKTLESQMATYEFAEYHRDIRDRVRALASGENPTYKMSWEDFEAMCRDIEPNASMVLVQIYLRDITGDILYFDQNERLRHRVFLRPDWVCNRIYAILSRKVLEREGLFDLDWVCDALRCGEEEALDFVELMRMFELVFPDKDEAGKHNGQFVAPQYLPEHCRKAEYLQDLKEDHILTHAFTLWFPDFLPKSHFARFISNWGAKAEGRVFWKNGLLFKTEGLKILVERNEEFKIRVDIQTGDKLKRDAAMRRIFQSFLDLEDGQGRILLEDGSGYWLTEDGSFILLEGDDAKFAISLNEKDFVWWKDVHEAMQTHARQIKTCSPETSKYIDIQSFKVFQKQIMPQPKKIFISYAHADFKERKRLETHLAPLTQTEMTTVWTDSQIKPGADWDESIVQEMESSDIILLLFSPDFIASKYIWEKELEIALQLQADGKSTVVPILLKNCLFHALNDVAQKQFIPSVNGQLKAVVDWKKEAGYLNVANEIYQLIKD